MAQTTPEEPTLIPPASETDAKPYTPPSKKNHVPAGVARLISVGLGLLLTLLAVVLIFSHKMSPTKSHGQASKRTPAQQQTTATTGVMPADENNTPSAATGSDPDNITPSEILATKNTLEAQKRHAKEAAAEAAATLAGMGQGTAGGAHLPDGAAGAMQTSKQFNALQKTIGSIAPFQPPAYNGASPLVNLPAGLGPSGINPEPPIARQRARGMTR